VVVEEAVEEEINFVNDQPIMRKSRKKMLPLRNTTTLYQ
jgi:hypothetical protein